MFTKLLAYEIRSRYRADARSFGAFIAVIAIAVGIVAAGLPGISGSTVVLAYALCALTPAACAIAALADYWKTLYGQRGYFTMSLPVSGATIFWAKITRMVIECLLALALAVGGILAVASAAAWSDGISLAEYTAGPRSARGRNAHLDRGPHDRRAAHPCDVVGRAGLRRYDDRRGRTLQSYGFRRAHHRFRAGVYRQPGAFRGWHVLPSAVRHD